MSGKRRLSYSEVDIEDDRCKTLSPSKLNKRKTLVKSSNGCSDEAWERRMDGFKGFACKKNAKTFQSAVAESQREDTQPEIDWLSDSDNGSDTDTSLLQHALSTSVSKYLPKANFDSSFQIKTPNSVDRYIRKRDMRRLSDTSKYVGRPVKHIVPRTTDSSKRKPKHSGQLSPNGDHLTIEPVISPDCKSSITNQCRMQINKQINEYDSDEEGCKECLADVIDSPDITECSLSGQSEAPSVGYEVKYKASDWAQNLRQQLVTPEKQKMDENTEVDMAADSAKKRPKHVKDGLADRAKKVISREKSAFAFWSHKKNRHLDSQESQHQVVYIHSIYHENSLAFAKCSHWTSSQSALTEPHLTVLFTASIANNLMLSKSSVVRIYPPWQSLSTSQSPSVILCTDLCEVLQQSGDDCAQQQGCKGASLFGAGPEKETRWSRVAHWECPCVTGRVMNTKSCPAQKHPCHLQKTDSGSDRLALTHAISTHHLTTIPAKSIGNSMSTSILECVETMGGCGASGVDFQATIQRVCCQQTTQDCQTPNRAVVPCDPSDPLTLVSGALRPTWSLLLQDAQGFLSQLSIPSILAEKEEWSKIINVGEGMLCHFKGLCVGQRLIQSRNPKLFSLVERIWVPPKQPTHDTSQEESQESQTGVPMMSAPSFCYTLNALPGESAAQMMGTGLSEHYRSPALQTLAHITADSTPRRVSFTAMLVYSEVPCDQQGLVMHLTDVSLQQPAAAAPSPHTLVCMVTTDAYLTPCPLNTEITFKDIFFNKGRLHLDAYSAVEVVAGLPCCVKSLKLTVLNALSRRDDLVLVEGCIERVDEETACSWQECPHCSSDQLMSTTNTRGDGKMFCASCQRSVDGVCEKMHLEVYLAPGPLLNQQGINTIKVTLCQGTIQKLLPRDEETLHEGYEVSNILGRLIGPLQCLITGRRQVSLKKQSVGSMKQLEPVDLQLKEIHIDISLSSIMA